MLNTTEKTTNVLLTILLVVGIALLVAQLASA